MSSAVILESWMTSWLLVAIPCVGAAFSLLSWSSLHRMKAVALLTTAAGLSASIGLWLAHDPPLVSMPFACLLPLAAFLSLLGQPLHRDNRMSWVMTLLLLGLGLGILISPDFSRDIMMAVLLGLLCGLIARYEKRSVPDAWRGLATYGLGVAGVLLSLLLPASATALPSLVVCAALLPLLPLHAGYLAVLTGLPGNLPAFATLLLPALGFHRILLLLPSLTDTMLQTVAILALVSACYGSIRALSHPRVLPRLAYAGLALFSIGWWYLADTKTAPVQLEMYLMAVGLAMSGLSLAWYAIRARYGDIDLRTLGGLAYPMPRFSTLLSLLALAALGMPPFGVFSGFMNMLLSPTFAPSAPFAIILLAWLSASWYFIDVVQQTIFGPQRLELGYEDLRRTESVSLVLLILLLLALGIAPSGLFQPSTPPPQDTVAVQVPT